MGRLSRFFWKYFFSIFTVAIQIVNPKGPETNKLLLFSSNSRPHIQIMSLTLGASQMQRIYVKLLETSMKRRTPFHWRSFTKMQCSQDPENCIWWWWPLFNSHYLRLCAQKSEMHFFLFIFHSSENCSIRGSDVELWVGWWWQGKLGCSNISTT